MKDISGVKFWCSNNECIHITMLRMMQKSFYVPGRHILIKWYDIMNEKFENYIKQIVWNSKIVVYIFECFVCVYY